jgi:hypothetical protein
VKKEMQHEYILGANYWSQKWGTEMWRHYDKNDIRADLKKLREYGVRYLRVFPNWRDFQPVAHAYAWRGTHGEYIHAETGEPVYGDGVDEGRIEDFRFGSIGSTAALCRGFLSRPELYSAEIAEEYAAHILEHLDAVFDNAKDKDALARYVVSRAAKARG